MVMGRVTSALDPTVGGEIHLRLLFEPLHVCLSYQIRGRISSLTVSFAQSPPRLTVDDFQILRRIGQGSFGQVFRVRKRDTKRIYAMKVIRKSSLNTPEALAQVVTERTVLAKTNDCPFLVGLKFSFQSAEELFLVMDYKGGGEVSAFAARWGQVRRGQGSVLCRRDRPRARLSPLQEHRLPVREQSFCLFA